MLLKGHIITSIPATVLTFTLTNSISLSLITFLVAIFIDIDHIPDYMLSNRGKFNYKDFVQACIQGRYKKLYLIFHSYELLLGLLVLYWIYNFNHLILSIIIGLAVHLISDQLANPVHPLSYFFFYRLYYRFSVKAFYYEKKKSKHISSIKHILP